MTSEMQPTIRPVILCGGAGTRLWPLSRESFPKQLLALAGERSLLQETAARLSGDRFTKAIIVSGEDQRDLVRDQLESSGAGVEAILLEPARRNTAAAAALAAAWVTRGGGDDLLLLMPSDHVIRDRDSFIRAIEIGVPQAERGAIVTFGATATGPNTQYGYIEADDDQPLSGGAFAIARFHEKPSAEKAADYVASGRFFWNAGIFLAKASTILGEMRHFLPESLEAISEAAAKAEADGIIVRPEPGAFKRAQNISIDNGIMEKTSRGVVVPVQMDWSDVGSWDAVWKLGDKDDANNVARGDIVALDTKNSLLRNESGMVVAVLGLDNMAVIAVRDAVLVAPLDRAAELKDLVERLRENSR